MLRLVSARQLNQSPVIARTVIIALTVLWASVPTQAAAQLPMSVFVSVPPQKFLVKRIGGMRVRVHIFLDPGRSPETFEPSPDRLAALAKARLYFRIGVPFEAVVLRSIPSNYPRLKVVQCCAPLDGASEDPHIWMSPSRARALAAMIRDNLAQADPRGAFLYNANFRKLSADLIALDGGLKELLRNPRTRYFIVAHAALGFFARDYGLHQLALETEGREAGPRKLARIVDIARAAHIHTIFVQKQFSTAPARALAREIGAKLVEIDPLAENYIANMYDIGHKVAEAVQ